MGAGGLEDGGAGDEEEHVEGGKVGGKWGAVGRWGMVVVRAILE